MRELPQSKVYEAEIRYMPYKDSIAKVLELAVENVPQQGRVIDLMCGPGFLLGELAEQRPDLTLQGVDIDSRYIAHAQQEYPRIRFDEGDVRTWTPQKQADLLLCTGALHHLAYEEQPLFVARIPEMITPNGTVILSDCYIDDYATEQERMQAAARLGYEYLKETIANGAPLDVVAATIDILHNDVMGEEFKTALRKRLPFIRKAFNSVETIKTWPMHQTEYGDYMHLLKK